MRRIVRTTPVSQDPRELVLAATLFTVAAVLLAGFAVTTLAGSTFDAGDLRDAGLAYRLLGWGKWLAFARLLWIAHRSATHHHVLGWKRGAMLWTPLVLLVAYGALQWRVVGVARIHYLARTGHPDMAPAIPAVVIAAGFAVAFAATALNALWVQRRQLRIAL
jgi:hypothetical protein